MPRAYDYSSKKMYSYEEKMPARLDAEMPEGNWNRIGQFYYKNLKEEKKKKISTLEEHPKQIEQWGIEALAKSLGSKKAAERYIQKHFRIDDSEKYDALLRQVRRRAARREVERLDKLPMKEQQMEAAKIMKERPEMYRDILRLKGRIDEIRRNFEMGEEITEEIKDIKKRRPELNYPDSLILKRLYKQRRKVQETLPEV